MKKKLLLLITELFLVRSLYCADCTRLLHASFHGDEDIVKVLIEEKAHVNQATRSGVTPLLIAAENGHRGVVNQLVAAKADPNLAMQNGATPLLIAAQNGHQGIVADLVEAKADVNHVTDSGYTALKCALLDAPLQSRADIVRILIDGHQRHLQAAYSQNSDAIAAIKNNEIEWAVHIDRFDGNAESPMAMLPAEVIEKHIMSSLSLKELAAFRLASRGCRLLVNEEWSRQQARNHVNRELNKLIRKALFTVSSRENCNDIIAVLVPAVCQEYGPAVEKNAALKLPTQSCAIL